MTETEPSTTLSPPDITKDKLFLVTGGTIFGITEPVWTTQVMPAWVTVFAREPDNAARPPREKHFRVLYDTHVGTVAELVELYREQLTRAFHAFACTPGDGGEQPVVPQTGEPSLRRQNDAIAKMCDSPGRAVSVAIKAGQTQYEEYQATRYKRFGVPKPRQSAYERDVLARLIAAYCDMLPEDCETGPSGPTTEPRYVQRLIDALTVLRQDRESADATMAARRPLTRDDLMEAMKEFVTRTSSHEYPTHIDLHPRLVAEVEAWEPDSKGKLADSTTLFGMTYAIDDTIPPDPGFVVR